MGFRDIKYNTEGIAAALKVDKNKLESTMKANRVGGFARVWSYEDKGKYSVVKLSTSKKRKDNDSYETDFQSQFVRFIGKAHEKLQNIDVGEKGVTIQIVDCEATTPYNAETKKGYNNYIVFDFDVPGENNSASGNAKKASASKSSKKAKAVEEDEDGDNDLPF